MILGKRTAVQNKRLVRLIEFLEKLPYEKFDFSTVVEDVKSNGHQCATVGCAIGWTPAIFRDIRWGYHKRFKKWNGYFEVTRQRNGKKEVKKGVTFEKIAQDFLGCPSDLFLPLAQDYVHSDLPDCGSNATPGQVAKMLRKYMKLVP